MDTPDSSVSAPTLDDSEPAAECGARPGTRFRARCRAVGVATEMLLTETEQVSDDGACAAALRLSSSFIETAE